MFDKYKTYREYLNGEKIGAECNISFRIPIPNQQTGSITFPGCSGKLLWAFEDGVMIRGATGEQFFAYKEAQYIEFPSQIQTVKSGLVGARA